MKRQSYLILLLGAISLPGAFAATSNWGKLGVGLGTLTHFVGKVQTDNQGSTNKFDFNPVALIQMPYKLPWENFSLIPQAGVGLPQEGRDPNIKKMDYFLLGDLGYTYNLFTMRAGGGFSFTTTTADGGSEVLRNGNTTESFPLPEGASTTRNMVANIGLQAAVLNDWLVQAEVMIFNPTSSFNRAVSYFIGAQYQFDLWK